jgi:hypothetical protein
VSVAKFLEENVDPGSYIYFLQSTSEYGGIRDSCIKAVNNTIPHLFYRYHWRTDLSETEAKQWALRAKKVPGNLFFSPVLLSPHPHPLPPPPSTFLHPPPFSLHSPLFPKIIDYTYLISLGSTFVVTCADGEVSDDVDPVSGKPGYVDWSYILLAKATWLIRNGATLVNHAPDTHNFWDSNFPGVNLDAPGPGSFFEFLLSSAYPEGYNRSYTVGKGGNLGTDYSILPGIELLKQQGSSGDLSRIAMVGDTLNTDILAGNQAGIQSVFVLSGVHTEEDLKYYDVHPTCILNNVGEIPAHAAPVFRKIINH